MIREVKSRKKNPAITSDHWHVVHACWSGNEDGEARFDRSILSEHADLESARVAAINVLADLSVGMGNRPRDRRDQVFVRKPNFKSLKVSGRRKVRPKED
jgi:hypothetical protein